MHETSLANSYAGIDRLQYFFISLGIGIVSVFTNVITGDPNGTLATVVAVIAMFAMLVTNILRLSNIGMSQWWSLLMFVPLANVWLGFRCQTAQAGWVKTRRLDRTGVKIAVVYITLVILLIAAFAVLFYINPQALNLPM
jgi:hypothetical protein